MIRRSLEPDTKMKIKHWTEEIVLPRLYELQSDLAILFLHLQSLVITSLSSKMSKKVNISGIACGHAISIITGHTWAQRDPFILNKGY